jgi:hypothetical protein
MPTRSIALLSVVLAACATQPSPAPAVSSSPSAVLAVPPVSTAAPAPASSAPLLVPSRSIGPLTLGMTRAEVGKLGLSVRPHPSGQMGDDVRMVGPYYVVFRADAVDSVELAVNESPEGVRIGTQSFSKSATAAELAGALRGCGPEEIGEGGNTMACEGRRTLLKRGASCAERNSSGDCLRWDPQHPGLSVQVLRSPL